MSTPSIARFIDHTLLRQDCTKEEVRALCREAVQLGCAAVCVPPVYVTTAAGLLKESKVDIATVIGFPFGYHTPSAKFNEAMHAHSDGATELDMVANISAIKSGDWGLVHEEISDVHALCCDQGIIQKVIIESGILTDAEIIRCCELAASLGVDFVKTSTGFASVGATVHAVQLMRRHLPERVQIKASGGIRTFAFAKELLDAGATRLGCSATATILREAQEATGEYTTP